MLPVSNIRPFFSAKSQTTITQDNIILEVDADGSQIAYYPLSYLLHPIVPSYSHIFIDLCIRNRFDLIQLISI